MARKAPAPRVRGLRVYPEKGRCPSPAAHPGVLGAQAWTNVLTPTALKKARQEVRGAPAQPDAAGTGGFDYKNMVCKNARTLLRAPASLFSKPYRHLITRAKTSPYARSPRPVSPFRSPPHLRRGPCLLDRRKRLR